MAKKIKYPKLRELKEAVKSLISPAYTTRFPKEPSMPAPKFRGKPEYYKDDCVGCGACAEVCPAGTIYMTDDVKAKTRRFELKLDSCLFCGNCQANCITEKGIMLSNQYDMVTYDRNQATVSVEKELLICEHCGCIIGAKDHIRFLARKLGVLAYSNPTLILANQNELKKENDFADISVSEPGQGRPVLFKILCPRCRRSAMLEEEYSKQL